MIASATSRARSAGIAPASPRLISLTPTISPCMFTSGPPGVAAEDRRVVADPADDRPDILAVERHPVERPEHARHDHLGVADDAHRDRLGERERTAQRQHAFADFQLETSPKCAAGNVRGVGGLSFRIAMSDSGSVPTSSAGISSRVASVQMRRASGRRRGGS